jgi:hypothetical protein
MCIFLKQKKKKNFSFFNVKFSHVCILTKFYNIAATDLSLKKKLAQKNMLLCSALPFTV